MSLKRFSVAAAVVVVAAASAAVMVHERRINSDLRSECQALLPQVEEAQRLRSSNEAMAGATFDANELDRLQAGHSELLQLRGVAPQFSRRKKELDAAQSELRSLQSNSPARTSQ